MFGLLNIHKPAGITSRDVVNRVQRFVKPVKAGHAGTLDPLATGVLVVCLGQATRLIEFVQRMPKRYVGTFLLGRHSDTEDVQGNVVELHNPPQPTRADVEQVLPQFVGEIAQVPPAYSALKVAGKRAYDLARQGQTVELAARPTMIFSIEIVGYEYPELTLDIRCGSGTYIRSLGRDIARAIGSEAVMSALVREEIGKFHRSAALNYADISAESLAQHLQPALTALDDLPRVVVTAQEREHLAHGRQILNRFAVAGEAIAAIGPEHDLAAILKATDDEHLQVVRYFPR